MRDQLPAPGGYQGQHRLGGRSGGTGHRRLLAVAAAVGAVLIGTAALARTLPNDPTASPAGSATSPEKSATSPTAKPSSLGTSVPPPESPAPPPPAVGEPTEAPPEPDPTPTSAPEPSPTSAAPVDLEFEAEAAELSGFVRLFPVQDASGGDVVGMIGNHESNHVRFQDVTVDAAGEYKLTLYYLTAPDREGLISVNDGDPVTVDFPGLGDLQTIDSVSIPVELEAGENDIWFGHVTGPAPALDRVTVTSNPGEPG